MNHVKVQDLPVAFQHNGTWQLRFRFSKNSGVKPERKMYAGIHLFTGSKHWTTEAKATEYAGAVQVAFNKGNCAVLDVYNELQLTRAAPLSPTPKSSHRKLSACEKRLCDAIDRLAKRRRNRWQVLLDMRDAKKAATVLPGALLLCT
jgi:hypothetical protein